METFMTQSQSLEERRPLFLKDVVGNQPVIARLAEQMRRGTIPKRALLFGPTGSGKTTIARIMARHFFCLERTGIGDPCGRCHHCREPLEDRVEYEEWTGQQLEDRWNWWEEHGPLILERSHWLFFIDEVQDLSEGSQKALYRDLERAKATVLFATTHRNEIKDAIQGRFGAHVYELRRPSDAEAMNHLQPLCSQLGIQVSETLLRRMTQFYGRDMRKCVDFVYTAFEQAAGGIVTEDFVDSILGTSSAAAAEPESNPAGRLRL
jgi:DNA polymerase III gamma/tau subunit